MIKLNALSRMETLFLRLWHGVRAAGGLALVDLLLPTADAASPYAGFYTGYTYISLSGTVTVPETAAGAAAFTVDTATAISRAA